MVLADCVKIPAHGKNMQKKLMCFFEQIDPYIVTSQHLAGPWAIKFYKRYKYRCKRWWSAVVLHVEFFKL
jgi:hypothetical protein